MPIENKKKRYLKHFFPEIIDKDVLPLNYKFIQIYTGVKVNKEGVVEEIPNDKEIEVSAYKIPKIYLYPVFDKPISKCFSIKKNKINDDSQ